MSTRKGMILAAGLGTRMRPITERIPKPLVEVAGVTLIDHALNQLKRHGIGEVVVNSSYKAELLEAHLAQRKHPHIQISREDTPLETGGGIAKALPLLGREPFFSLNSDTICIDAPQRKTALQRLEAAWDGTTMDVLMLLHPVAKAIGYAGAGDFVLREDGAMRRRQPDERAPYVFTGVQLIHPRLFAAPLPEGPFSMNVLYNRHQGGDGFFTRIRAIVHEGDWLHVGDPTGLAQANSWFAAA